MLSKLMSASDAVKLIRDGDTVSFSGFGTLTCGGWICRFIEQSFLEGGHPRDLTLYNPGGMGFGIDTYAHARYLAHEGLLRRAVLGHMAAYWPFAGMIDSNVLECHNIPQGILALLTNELAAKHDGYLSKVGLYSSIDPRFGGGALNDLARANMQVELREVNGEEYLYYKAIPIDVAIIQGTYADRNGNISFEGEGTVTDALALAMAAHNNGGKVIALVKEVCEDRYANPHLVKLPAFLTDAIVINEEYCQTVPILSREDYFCGKGRVSDSEAYAILENMLLNEGKRDATHKTIARRAALEIRDGDIANIGIGIPLMIAMEARRMGILNDSIITTLENGVSGGTLHPSVFGVAINPDIIHDQATQFRFYEGGGLDIGFLGAMEVDRFGNVNASKKGPMNYGVGGFNFITHSAKRIIFCFKLLNNSSFALVNGQMTKVPGVVSKIVKDVESLSFHARYNRSLGKQTLYVTDRCVFTCDDDGLVLTEIAPGMDLEQDILKYIEFRPKISPDLKEMPAICFE